MANRGDDSDGSRAASHRPVHEFPLHTSQQHLTQRISIKVASPMTSQRMTLRRAITLPSSRDGCNH